MRISLVCDDCSKEVIGPIGERGCFLCGSTNISKNEYHTNADWLAWWFDFAKGDVATSRINGKIPSYERM